MADAKGTPGAARARLRRVKLGVETEAAARAAMPKGFQRMLGFPLLQVLEENGGAARSADGYEALAERLQVPAALRQARRTSGDGRKHAVYEQQVRWARQTAALEGLVVSPDRGVWELSEKGWSKLQRVRRGTAYLVWRTDLGVALWAHAEDAAAEVETGSLQLICTSPIYPIRSGRDYGRMTADVWLDWMRRVLSAWRDRLAPDGTLCLNLAECFVPGMPTVTPYLHRIALYCVDELGLHQLPTTYWHNPAKLANLQWSGRERLYPAMSVEQVLTFGRSPWPMSQVDPIMVPRRSTKEPRTPWARETRRRPGGYDIRDEAFHGEGPAMPDALVVAGGVGRDRWARRCLAAGLPIHGARFPKALPERLVLQYTQEGDTVADIMAGSCTTAEVCEALGRRHIMVEPHLVYLAGGALRVDGRLGFRRLLPADSFGPA